MNSRQPWQRVLWLSKLLGISICVFCFTGVQFFLFKFFFSGGSLFFKLLVFHSCFVFQVGRKCKFFQWCDDEICEHGKVLIPEQRRRIIRLEAEVASYYKREKFYIVGLAFLLVICGICLCNCMFG